MESKLRVVIEEGAVTAIYVSKDLSNANIDIDIVDLDDHDEAVFDEYRSLISDDSMRNIF